MQKVVAIFICLVAFAAAEGMYDLPPPTQEDFAMVDAQLDNEVWPQRDDEYGSIGEKSQLMEVQLALSDASATDRSVPLEAEGENAPSDLLDVDVNSLIPKINTRRYRDLRNMLKRLKAKLRPLHARICKSGFSSCLARRRANARILKSVSDKCAATRKGVKNSAFKRKLRSFRQKRAALCAQGLCAEGAEHLHKVSRTYSYLRRTYSRLYIRYAMLIGKYYQRRFRTLVRVFLNVIRKLKNEALLLRKKNSDLSKKLDGLKKQSQQMRVRTTKIHEAQKAALAKQQKEHKDQIEKTARNVRAVQAELRGEQTKVGELGLQLEKLNAKLRSLEEQRAKAKADAEAVTAARNKINDEVKKTLVEIGNLTAQIKDAQRRIAELEKVQNALLKQRELLRDIVAKLGAIKGANERASARIQTSYNSLKNRYEKLTSGNENIQNQLKEEISSLRNGILKQAQRCVPDACGKCNGDESTCANKHTRGHCWVAGDPWVGTFDGVQYPFLHHDGQFVLARHGNPVNFEVQSYMRQFASHWWVRTNMGVAIRGGRNVLTNYFHWGSGVVAINGRQFNLPWQQWVRIGPGFTVYRNNAVTVTARYENARKQPVEVVWTNAGVYTNIYINTPWQWSSGRSTWGMCGDNDGWAGNDATFVARNVWKLFQVTGGNRDMFQNPRQRALDLEISDFSAEDLSAEKKLDELNGITQLEDLEEYTAGDLPSLVEIEEQGGNAAAVANKVLGANGKANAGLGRVSLRAATPAARNETRAQCRGIHGTTRKECQFDILRGVDAVIERGIMQRANVVGKEVELKRCTLIDPYTFMLVSSETLPKPETAKEGYSYAFMFSPRDIISKNRCVVLEKGSDLFVTQTGAKLSVGVGSASCSIENVFRAGKWTAVSFAVYRNGDLQVFVNRKPACAAKGNGKFTFNKEQLIVGSSESSDSCNGRLAHLYYVPQSITKSEALIHGQRNPYDCHPTKARKIQTQK